MSLSEQARCFLASLLLGFILSLLYDLLRAVRLQRATKRRFTSALDLLYCAAFALLTFLFALRIGGGEAAALYALLGAARRGELLRVLRTAFPSAMGLLGGGAVLLCAISGGAAAVAPKSLW